MTAWRNAKIRDDETWAAVRRAWESGETAASCVRRFDVGLANLWRRRASEGWERGRPVDPRPEPVEGWVRFASRQREAFEHRLGEERALARTLAQSMQGAPMTDVPLWHVPWVLAWRAEHLGAEIAAGDQARNADQDWADVIWNADGTLKHQSQMDWGMVRHHRDLWRKEVGLPDGAAEDWP